MLYTSCQTAAGNLLLPLPVFRGSQTPLGLKTDYFTRAILLRICISICVTVVERADFENMEIATHCNLRPLDVTPIILRLNYIRGQYQL